MTKLVLLACLSLAACSSDVFSGPDDGGGQDATSDGTTADAAHGDAAPDAVLDDVVTPADGGPPIVDIVCSKDGGLHCAGPKVCCSNGGWQLGLATCTAPSGCQVIDDALLACDDSSDCPSNQICCASLGSTSTVQSSQCAASCDAGVQLCKPGQCLTGTCAVYPGQPGWLEACQ